MSAVRVVDAAEVAAIDRYAEDLARALGFAEPPGVSALADRVWGAGAIGLVSRGPAFRLVRRGTGHALFLRDDLARDVRHWTAARELARFCLERDGARLSAALVGGAIVLPRAVFARCLARGTSSQRLAECFGIPLAVAMAREADLSGLATAIVTPKRASIFGGADARLPRSAKHLRALAAMPTVLARWEEHGATVLRPRERSASSVTDRFARPATVLQFRAREVRA